MKNNSIKNVVAVGIGAALFFVLGRFVQIPSGIPNTNISVQYAILGMLATMYGPVAGALIGFIGHTLIDLSWGGAPWWSWVIASTAVGAFVGFLGKKIPLSEGTFGKKEIVTFAIINVVANVVAWLVIAQGAMAAVANSVTAVIIGALLCAAYSKTIAGKGSLDKE